MNWLTQVSILSRRRNFSHIQNINAVFGSHPAHAQFLFLVTKQLGPKAARPPSPSAKVKNEWSCMSTPSTHLHCVDRDKCTSYCMIVGIQLFYEKLWFFKWSVGLSLLIQCDCFIGRRYRWWEWWWVRSKWGNCFGKLHNPTGWR